MKLRNIFLLHGEWYEHIIDDMGCFATVYNIKDSLHVDFGIVWTKLMKHNLVYF